MKDLITDNFLHFGEDGNPLDYCEIRRFEDGILEIAVSNKGNTKVATWHLTPEEQTLLWEMLNREYIEEE